MPRLQYNNPQISFANLPASISDAEPQLHVYFGPPNTKNQVKVFRFTDAKICAQTAADWLIAIDKNEALPQEPPNADE